MTETGQSKRRGRPPKNAVANPPIKATAPLPEAGTAVGGEFGSIPVVKEWPFHKPDEIKVHIPLRHFSEELKTRIRECNEISIVCKLKREDGVSINHSKHDALWLKEYI